MTQSELNTLFRKTIVVVPGGPADRTRGKGMLAILDALAEEATAETALTRVTDLATLEQERAAQPPVPLLPGVEYTISGNWNNAGDQVVYVHAADATRFRVEGTLLNQGVATAVLVDVAAGTAVALGGGGTVLTELQLISQSGSRTAVIKLTSALTLSAMVALPANNVQSYALQVNTYAAGWQAGTAHPTLVDAQVAIDALTPAQYAAGAELEITTTAVDATAEAILIVSFRA
jgi:hypothetical protein